MFWGNVMAKHSYLDSRAKEKLAKRVEEKKLENSPLKGDVNSIPIPRFRKTEEFQSNMEFHASLIQFEAKDAKRTYKRLGTK